MSSTIIEQIDGLINTVDKMSQKLNNIEKVQNTTLQILRQISAELFHTDIEHVYSPLHPDQPIGVKESTMDRSNQNNYLNYACTRMYDVTGDLSWICGFYMILKNNKQDIDLLFKRLEKLDIDLCENKYNDIRRAFENYFEVSFLSVDMYSV